MRTVDDLSKGLVIDASALVAALVDSNTDGRWALNLVSTSPFLASPEICYLETLNIVRRHERSSQISPVEARIALTSLRDLPLELVPVHPLIGRIWELRSNLTCYDAAYIAVAENLSLPLATLDGPMRRAPGSQCTFLRPPSQS